MNAALLYEIPCELGEGPCWHSQRQSIFWADIEGKSIYEMRWPQGIVQHWPVGRRVSLIVPAGKDQVLLALQGGIARFNLKTGSLDWLCTIDPELRNNRCNDGACDSLGRLWVGTMDLGFAEGAGSLFRVGEDCQAVKVLGQLTIANGLVWSIDNQRAYFIDSPTQTVKSYRFDSAKGELSGAQVIIEIPKEMGTPDGMCMDQAGMLWIAHWGGYGVYRWDPASGKLIDQVRVEVPQVSSCCFGGEGLSQLFITTARQNLSPEELVRYPRSGSLFSIRLPVGGRSLFACRL
jgi:sugar lactone lactonase YvrE